MLWTVDSVPFHFGKGSSGVLANCFLCGTKTTLSFSLGPACSIFSAEACALLQALCWSWQHQQVCHFSFPPIRLSLCPHHPLLCSIFPSTSISLADLAGTAFSLLPFYQATMGLGHLFHPGNDATNELARQGALLELYAIPCSLSPLISHIHFSWTGGVLSHQNFLTHRFPRFPLKNLCSVIKLAVFSLV